MAEAKSLAAKIATIANEIGAIAKEGKNAQQGYAFIEYAQVAAKARELQAKYGVAIVPTVESYEVYEVTNKYGNIGYHYLLKLLFTVINADDPDDKIVSNWVGESTDYGDKGINKAITSGVKYFTMRLYNISDKGEQDADATTPEPNVGAQNAKPKDANLNAKKKEESKNSIIVDSAKVEEIKKKMAEIDNIDELRAYWVKLDLNFAYKRILEKRFKDRAKELALPEDPDYGE